MTVFWNKNSFCSVHKPTPLCSQTNPPKNWKFGTAWAVGEFRRLFLC